MQKAVNPQTGEVLFLVDNQWVKPTQTALNPQTGENAYLVNNSWQVMPMPKPATPAEPTLSPEEQMMSSVGQTSPQQPPAGLLAGTTLPKDAGPMSNRMIEEVGTAELPITKDLPKLDVSQMPTAEDRAKAQFGITPEMGMGEKALRTAKGSLYGAATGLEQTWLGGARMISDITGFGKEGVEGVSKQLGKEQAAVEQTYAPEYGLKIAKDIGSSVVQNLPTIGVGLYTGTAGALTSMFTQSFMQTYDDSRNEGLGVAASTARSALYGTAEAIGESLGLPFLLKGAKEALKGVPTAELASTLSKYILKEIPGEQLTYVAQFLTDKGFGLNPEAGMKEFLQGAQDTALVTVGQTAVMGGAGMATNKILKEMRDLHSKGDEGIPQAADMMKQAGFTFERPQPQGEVTVQGIPPEAVVPPPVEAAPAAAPAVPMPGEVAPSKAIIQEGDIETPKEEVTPVTLTPKKTTFTKAPNNPAIEAEGLAIADELEKLGDKEFAIGARANIQRFGGLTTPDSLDFYRKRLVEAQQKAGEADVMPAETFGIDNYLANYKADKKRFDDFIPNAPEDVKGIVDKSNEYLQAITDKINGLGYKVLDINTGSPKELQDLKSKLSGIAGSTVSFAKNAEHIAKNNRFANPEKTQKIIAQLEQDFAEADQLLGAEAAKPQAAEVVQEPVQVEAPTEAQKTLDDFLSKDKDETINTMSENYGISKDYAEKAYNAEKEYREAKVKYYTPELINSPELKTAQNKHRNFFNKLNAVSKKQKAKEVKPVKEEKAEKIDTLSFKIPNESGSIDYLLDANGVFTREDTVNGEKDKPLTFVTAKDGEPEWIYNDTVAKEKLKPIIQTKVSAKKIIAKERALVEQAEKEENEAQTKEGRVETKKEAHIEGKKSEPVTTKTIEEAIDKAEAKFDYKKIKTAVKNQFEQAIKRAKIQTEKEWTAATIDKNSYVTIDIPGDGKFKVKNNVERLKELQTKMINATVPKVGKEPSGPSSGTIEAFKGMVDDKDMENAIEYAKLKDLDPKTVKLTPAQRNIVDKYLKNPAEFERQKEQSEQMAEARQTALRADQDKRIAKRLAADEEREEEARFKAVIDTTIRSTESQLKADIKNRKITSMDAKRMADVFANYPEGSVQDYTVKAIEKLAGIKPAGTLVSDIVKDVADKLEEGLLIGDEVRFGNIPGVVVGLEGDYVKFRPDTASNPKAYQRIQKSKVKFISRPDQGLKSSASKDESKFGTEAGELKADMAGLVQLLGANMYSSNLVEVSVKELLQNAFDAVKGAVSDKKEKSLYKAGNIEIDLNIDKRTIRITDNARGMTPNIVKDAFFTLGGSDKSDLDPTERSGGLGLAKMGFMMGAGRLKLDTVRDGVRTTVDATPKEIAGSNFEIKKSPAKKGEHGTTVEVTIPEYYTDPKTGEQKDIYFWSDIESIDPLKQPLIGPVNVEAKVTRYGSTETTKLPMGENFDFKEIPFKTKANFSWGSADVYFGISRKERPNHQVLSSGVYQFNGPSKYQNYFMVNDQEKIPFDIIINVKPTVDAKHPNYPFENSRESFKNRIAEDIESLGAFLTRVARGEEAKDLQESFKNVVSMPRVEVGEDVAEVSKKLKKVFDQRGAAQEVKAPEMPKEIDIRGTVVSDPKGNVIVDTKAKKEEKKEKSTFEAETEAPGMDKFMIEMKQDPKLPIFHNNTNVDFIKVGQDYGNPEKFFAELGTLMVEMKEVLANNKVSGLSQYQVLKPENLFFAGIGVDKKYGGVHIKVPYKAVLINPFYEWGAKSLFGIRQNFLNTMIHEIAHTGSMDHGVSHNNQMIKVEQYLEDEGMMDYFRDSMLDILSRHESTFTAMKEAYGKSTTQNTAKSLEDYGKGSPSARGDAGSSEDQDGAIPAGEGLGRDEHIPTPSKSTGKSELGGGRSEVSSVRELLAKHNRPNTPLHPTSEVADAFMGSVQKGKKIYARVKENPMMAAPAMVSKLDRATTYARNKNIWYGTGLEQADFSKYNGQLRTGQKDAIASVAVTNAIHAGHVGTQVLIQGKLEYNDATQMFQAAKSNKSMANVIKLKSKLMNKLGDQEATDLINGYFEAKRSRSIINEYLNREAAYEQSIESGEDQESATKNLKNIEIARQKVNMDDEQIDDFIAMDKKFPELRQMMDNWTAVNHNMLDNMVFSGVISKRRAADLKKIEDYVPWYRIMDEQADIHQPTGGVVRGLTNVAQDKKFKKGEVNRDIDDIVDNMIHNVMMMTRNSMRNYAANRVVAEYGTRKENGKLKVFATEGVDADGVRFNIIVNGRRIIVQIKDPLIAESVIGMENIEIPMNKILATMANGLRRTITFSGVFQVKQLFMDAPTAAWVSGLKNPFAVWGGTFSSFIQSLRKEDPIVQLLKSYGIGGFQSTARTPEKELKLEIGLLNHSNFAKAIKFLDHIGDSSDYAQRRSIYKRVMKETSKTGNWKDGDQLQALLQANNVIDFLKHGSGQSAQFLTRTVSFMNAYAQQIDVLAQTLAGGGLKGKDRAEGIKRMAITGGLLASTTLLYCMVVGADDDYQELDDQTKIRNLYIPYSKKVLGHAVILPMHTSASFFFKSIPELLYNKVMNQGTKNEMDNTRLRTALKDAAIDSLLGPNAVPTGAKPFVEIGLNHSFFTGGQVTPKGMENLEAAEQYTSATSELGKVFSALTSVPGTDKRALNPIEADHLMRSLFGSVAAMSMWGSNMLAGDRPESRVKDLPVIGQFVLPEVPRGNESLFYDFKERSDEKYNTYTKLMERNKFDDADKYLDKNMGLIAAHDYVTAMESGLKEINKQIRSVGEVKDPSFTKSERRKEITDLQEVKKDILDGIGEVRKESGL